MPAKALLYGEPFFYATTMVTKAETQDRGSDAAKLCALVFSNGKIFNEFAMSATDAVKQAGLPPQQIEKVIDWAIVSGWIRRRARHLELTAAGIYVAKTYLDLPR